MVGYARTSEDALVWVHDVCDRKTGQISLVRSGDHVRCNLCSSIGGGRTCSASFSLTPPLEGNHAMHAHRTRNFRPLGFDVSRTVCLADQTRLKNYGRKSRLDQ